MKLRDLGASGLQVTPLGFGAGALGDEHVSDGDAERLVHAAVDLGLGLIDTARSYGASEARLGRFLGARRQRIVLSTKLGYGVEGVPDWTAESVTLGIEGALARLATDVIDIVHLHSCGLETLESGEVVGALESARTAGKIRVAAYSGENQELDWALTSGRFGVLQHSVSVFDQGAIERVSVPAEAAGVGVIAKRALGNAPWRFEERPDGQEADKYWGRYRELAIETGGLAWPELAVRFSAYAPGVSTALTGTSRVEHLEASVRAVQEGPLSEAAVASLRARFRDVGQGWPGII